MSTGVASPPSHPPLPKKPSLAPKPKGLAVTSPRNTLIEGDSIESTTSTSSSDTITNDSSPVTPEIQTSIPEASKPKGSPSRPTPKPRKTINYKANGTPEEVAPSPRPRVLPKRNIPQQESDQSRPAEESSSSTLPNGNECNVVTNGTTSSPRERPSVPVRRLTLGSSDLTPKVCPRTSPKWSPVRAPLQRSSSSTSDYSASSSSVTDGESDTQQSYGSSDTKGEEQNNPSAGPPIEAENRDANTSLPTHRPKPNISPKKPSLAMLSKRNTVFSIDSASFDKDNEKLPAEIGKKTTPQRPSFPPKRLSVIPVPQGSPSKPTVKSKPPAQQSTEVPKEDSPQVNGNKTEELSEVVPSSGEPSNNNSLATKDITEKHSTLKSTNYEPTSPASSGTKNSQPVEDPKAPPILPRKTIPRNPVAPPRRVKSMSESDPNYELNTDVNRSDENNKETSCQQKSLERDTKLKSEGEERNGGKIGDNSDNSNDERSTFKRNRRAVKSCDQLAFDSMKSPKDKRKVSNGEVQQKPKPPRPPPPSKPPGLIHQASLQSPPPRPKPIRAKTIDMTSQAKDKVKTESTIKTRKHNSPFRSKKLTQVTCGSDDENPDSSDWEIIDLTPQQKQQIDETGRGKIVTSESCEEVANHKPKNDAKIEPEHKDRLTPSKTSTNEQPEQPEKLVCKSEETLITKESEPETEKQPPGAAVSQLKLRKAQPPVPAQRNSIEGSPIHKPSSTSVLEERDVSSSNRNSQEISGRPLSQGSPVNGRSPNSSPKKTLKDRGRGSSPRRPSCAPPPPPPGAPQPNVATPHAQSPPPKKAPVQPKSTAPADLSSAPKPKRPAPPRPMAPPIKTSSNSRSNSQKPALPQNNDDEQEDQTNIYTEANAPSKNGEDGEDSDTSSRDHDYELIPDPRRSTLTRNTEPTSSSDGETRKDSSNRASGYIDDGLYLEPNQREDEELFENEYVYPEFMPANNIPVSPPTPPPNPELDLVFTPEHPPVEPKSRVSSVPRRKAPQKPKRSHSVRSDASCDSHSYFDMTGGSEIMERAHRSPSDHSGSLTDSSGNEDASLSEEYDDEGSYAGVAELPGTEDGNDDFELPEARNRLQSLGRKAQKAFMVAKEIKDSEKVFVNVLKLLNVDLRQVIDEASKKNGGKPVIDKAVLDQIIGHLPHLQMFNECLLTDLETRIRNWSTTPKIADIFLTKGHFLKLYSTYILDFERITAAFDDACNKNPVFTQVVKEFEMSEQCRSLAIKHYMLKPVQRIPQYKMLLTDYLKQLDADSEEFEKTTDALAIVSEVANHANESMRQGDNFEKLLAIQHSMIGNQEIVKPGRRFIKEGELLKMSRRVNQPRKFFLLSDILLHTTPFPPGQYKLNNVLSLAGMKVRQSSQESQDSNELEIISVQRSFTLLASSKEECEAWYNALTKTINEYENKKSSFDLIKPEHKGLAEGDTSSLGRKAPLWIPDSRVTMCMICTSEFTMTWRRHHCRACGKVTCGSCSKNKATLMYLSDKEARVCDNCYETLVVSQRKDGEEVKERTTKKSSKGNKTKRRKSNINRSSALKVSARDESNSSMGGYLWLRSRKKDWKRMWYRIKEKVLYTYKASEDVVALSSTPLLGYAVCVINETFEGYESGLILQLTQGRMKIILRSETPEACARWNEAMLEASCLD